MVHRRYSQFWRLTAKLEKKNNRQPSKIPPHGDPRLSIMNFKREKWMTIRSQWTRLNLLPWSHGLSLPHKFVNLLFWIPWNDEAFQRSRDYSFLIVCVKIVWTKCTAKQLLNLTSSCERMLYWCSWWYLALPFEQSGRELRWSGLGCFLPIGFPRLSTDTKMDH